MTLFQIVWSSLPEDRFLMEINAASEQVESFIEAFQKEGNHICDIGEFEAFLQSHGIGAERIFVEEIFVEL